MKQDRLRNILLIVGVALIVISLGTLLISVISQRTAAREARDLVIQLRQLMPKTYAAAPDDRVNVTMSSMEVSGQNFCGILEVPAYNTDLPICDAWDPGNLYRYPCRYTGSIHDGSLVIGGSDGQLNFMKLITGGDQVYVTDMTGGRYRCIVQDVIHTKDVSVENLTGQDADLVLYAKNSYSLDYTLVICKIG